MTSAKDFERIYDQHAPRVQSILFRMCPRHEVDDLTQECFIRVWKNIDNFRGDSSLATWIYRVAMNVAYDAYRRKGARPQTQEMVEDSAELRVDSRSLDRLADQQAVLLALESLSADHRSVLVLHVLEEMSVEEVARTLEIPEGTVKSRLFHARELARKFLINKGINYEPKR